jgi:hypothetical protein
MAKRLTKKTVAHTWQYRRCVMAEECVSLIPGIKELLADPFDRLRRL